MWTPRPLGRLIDGGFSLRYRVLRVPKKNSLTYPRGPKDLGGVSGRVRFLVPFPVSRLFYDSILLDTFLFGPEFLQFHQISPATPEGCKRPDLERPSRRVTRDPIDTEGILFLTRLFLL